MSGVAHVFCHRDMRHMPPMFLSLWCMMKLRAPKLRHVRVLEKAAGRMAITGIVTGTVIENMYSTSFLTQLHHEAVPVAALCAVISAATIRAHPEGIEEDAVTDAVGARKDPEIVPGRTAMLFVLLLFGMELLLK